MTSRKRSWWPVWIGVGLLAALAVLLLLRAKAPPEAARLLPESDAILYANLRPLRTLTRLDPSGSPQQPVHRSRDFQTFVDATGILPERDLDSVAFALHRMKDPHGPNGAVAYSEVFIGHFDAGRLRRAIAAARELQRALPPRRRARPIAVVGLNPHAGEAGLLGGEETWVREVIANETNVVGPLVPDAAFLPRFWPDYSVYVSPYHDQGLIPFKLVHGFNGGVHLTLGLPFVRSSVDHGTAKDLFGKNVAAFGSMKDAITTALRLTKEP